MFSPAKEPTIAVPCSVFLELVSAYKTLSKDAEVNNADTYLTADHLEKRAYRKYLAYRKSVGSAS